MERWIRWAGMQLAAAALMLAPAAGASADCNILEQECGATKKITVQAAEFVAAVAQATQSNGEQHTNKIKGHCDLKFSAGGTWKLTVPPAVTGRQTCEIKLLTGGKSHSKMKKQCAIWKWTATDQGNVDKSGVGMESGRKILKQPTDHTRQKQWHVKLWTDPGMKPPSFSISSVTLKVPADSSLKTNASASQLRSGCFQ